jgi:hypothetical protein
MIMNTSAFEDVSVVGPLGYTGFSNHRSFFGRLAIFVVWNTLFAQVGAVTRNIVPADFYLLLYGTAKCCYAFATTDVSK